MKQCKVGVLGWPVSRNRPMRFVYPETIVETRGTVIDEAVAKHLADALNNVFSKYQLQGYGVGDPVNVEVDDYSFVVRNRLDN